MSQYNNRQQQNQEGRARPFAKDYHSYSISFDNETIEALDKKCKGKGERSKFVRQAVREKLKLG